MTGNHPLQIANRERDLWFRDEVGNCYFFPQGWCDEIYDGNEPELELFGYMPTHKEANSPVDTMYMACADVEKLIATDEATALVGHPAMKEYLDAINAE